MDSRQMNGYVRRVYHCRQNPSHHWTTAEQIIDAEGHRHDPKKMQKYLERQETQHRRRAIDKLKALLDELV